LLPTTLKPLHSPETHQDSAIGQKAKNPAKQQPLLATNQQQRRNSFCLSKENRLKQKKANQPAPKTFKANKINSILVPKIYVLHHQPKPIIIL
jgi:hypothetical protein